MKSKVVAGVSLLALLVASTGFAQSREPVEAAPRSAEADDTQTEETEAMPESERTAEAERNGNVDLPETLEEILTVE